RDVLRTHLTVVLDAVGRDVVQERGAMLAGRARPYQLRMLTQETRERGGVTRDDGQRRRFERGDRRGAAGERIDVQYELRPAQEAVCPGDDELRVGERAHRIRFVSAGKLRPRELRDGAGALVDLPLVRQRTSLLLHRGKPFDPPDGPAADGIGIARPARL